jgi:hypothetical protein
VRKGWRGERERGGGREEGREGGREGGRGRGRERGRGRRDGSRRRDKEIRADVLSAGSITGGDSSAKAEGIKTDGK